MLVIYFSCLRSKRNGCYNVVIILSPMKVSACSSNCESKTRDNFLFFVLRHIGETGLTFHLMNAHYRSFRTRYSGFQMRIQWPRIDPPELAGNLGDDLSGGESLVKPVKKN